MSHPVRWMIGVGVVFVLTTATAKADEARGSWKTGSWTQCSKPCGGGMQVRTVDCVDPDGKLLPSSRCSGSRPYSEQPCNTEPCKVHCVVSPYSEWSPCSARCGGGVRMRTRTVLKQPENGGRACPELQETTACNTESCRGDRWWKGRWGQCSERCGGGKQKRIVKCVNRRDRIVDESRCPADKKPAIKRPCNEQSCGFRWFTGPWGKCSVECGGGTERRQTECRDGEGQPAGRWKCRGRRPTRWRPCNLWPCKTKKK